MHSPTPVAQMVEKHLSSVSRRMGVQALLKAWAPCKKKMRPLKEQHIFLAYMKRQCPQAHRINQASECNNTHQTPFHQKQGK